MELVCIRMANRTRMGQTMTTEQQQEKEVDEMRTFEWPSRVFTLLPLARFIIVIFRPLLLPVSGFGVPKGDGISQQANRVLV